MHMPLVLTNRRRRGGSASAPAFSPSTLYSSGSQGIWLDPSDLSTMFSDRAGTTPVTTPGTVVGLRLDKSGRGNHAVAPTDAARPIYGVEPKGGRRNLLTWSEDFGNAAWVKTRATATVGALTENFESGIHIAVQNFTYAAGDYTFAVDFKPNGRNWIVLQARSSSSYFDLTGAGSLGNVFGTVTSRSITLLPDGYYRCVITVPATAGADNVTIYLASANGAVSYTGNGTSGVLVRNAQLELGSTATNYQRVLSAYDITEAGVATCHYVQYDGSDDSMSTSAIDFTATDKMSVFAGVRKLSDTTGLNASVIVESSASASSNSGSFYLFGRTGFSPAARYQIGSGGTTFVVAGTNDAAFTAPISNVLSGLADISGDTLTLRVNGTQVAQTTTDQGTGNYGNYALFIGRRNNASLPFNGKDYGIIVVGKTASAGEISDTETWLAARTSGVSI